MQDGEGLGFGNKISAQTVAIVRAAKEAKRVYRVDDNSPVSHSSISTSRLRTQRDSINTNRR